MKKDKPSLNNKQKKFVREYVKDFNTSKAMKKAGYSNSNAIAGGRRMLENVGVKEEIEKYIQRDEFEFFDIKNDPNETTNLSFNPKYNELLRAYKKKMKEMQKITNDPWLIKWSYE